MVTATAAAMAVVANRQRIAAEQREDEAVALALAAQSRTMLITDPGLAVALASEATRATGRPLWQAQSALVDARVALASHTTVPLVEHEGTGDVGTIAALDSDRVVYLARDVLEVRDAFDTAAQSRALADGVTAFAVSLEGRTLASVTSSRLSLWSTDSLTTDATVYEAQIRPRAVTLSSDAEEASIVDESGNFEVVSLATMSRTTHGVVDVGRTRAQAMSADGDMLAIGGSAGRVKLIETATGTPLPQGGTLNVRSPVSALADFDGRNVAHRHKGRARLPVRQHRHH